MELKRVVVTGLGALTPVGNTAPETWENLLNGVSGAGPITHFDASLFKTQFACEVKNFNVNEHLDRKEARKMDLYTQYALVAAMEAVKDSGLDVEKEDLNRIGVIFGVGIGGMHTFEEETGKRAKTAFHGYHALETWAWKLQQTDKWRESTPKQVKNCNSQ
jgi:3-oxoacyl-[acyl-carrier-protein] synthase II